MSGTPRLSLPFLTPGQAQKEFFHNEALQVLDAVVAGAVEELPRSDPPGSPAVGAAYIVGNLPTGAWTGKGQCLAAFTEGGWRFVPAFEGLNVQVKSTGTRASFRAGEWDFGSLRGSKLIVDGQQVVGPRESAIEPATGGATVDAEARAAIGKILDTLRSHGLIEA